MEPGATRHQQPPREHGTRVTAAVRASEWWEFKLSPIFATVYATAFLLNLSIASAWPLLLLALAALVPGAAYVSVVNDLTDREDDLASGKPNRLAGRSRAFVAAALACCILPGVGVALYWRGDPLLLSLYLAAWAAFSLYSIPPFRLKSRGGLGVLADASGAHLFPTLLVVSLVYRWVGAALDPVWFAAAGAWSLSFGLRGILWHQLSDARNDEKIGLRTFVSLRTVAHLRVLGNFVIFPVELAALAVILWRAGSRPALAFLCLYALMEWSRKALWKVNLVVVEPKDRYHVLMHEYYEVFLPLAFLISSAARRPEDALVLAAHLLLFPRRATQTMKDAVRLLWYASGKFFRRAGDSINYRLRS